MPIGTGPGTSIPNMPFKVDEFMKALGAMPNLGTDGSASGATSKSQAQGGWTPPPPNISDITKMIAQGNMLGAQQAQNQAMNPNQSFLGGPPVPSEFQTPSGPIEQFLFNLFGGGAQQLTPQLNPLVGQLAGGQIPAAIQAQVNNMMQRQAAQLAENYGRSGAMFGTDLAGVITREQGRTMTDMSAEAMRRGLDANQLAANNTAGGLQRWMGLGGMLQGMESQRLGNAFNLYFQEFLRQQGLPPELLALLQAGNLGGGGTITQQGPDTTGSAIAGGISGIAQLLPMIMSMGGGA